MGKIRAFGAFWYDFIIGDDWRVAVGVALAFVVCYVASRAAGLNLWWVVPLAVVFLLPFSIRRATRASG